MVTPPKLIFLVTEDWYFWAHRLPQAQAARAAGFDVAVATRVQNHGERIRAAGFTLHPLRWRRRSANPFAALAAVLDTARLYRRERPALVHHVSQKPILIGSMAAAFAGVPFVVNAFTGLGFLFVASGLNARTSRTILLGVLRFLGRRPGVRWLVENPDDGALLVARGVAPAKHIVLIRGSGVDLKRYKPLPEPEGPVVIACATRLLHMKGVGDLVAAFRLLRSRGSAARLLIAGTSDAENPSAILESEIRGWAAEPGIEWLGHVEDVREIWARAHIAALASRGGEGIPMTLLEAAACGRPLIATDVPGCREIAHPGINALLVPVGAIEALADAMERLARDAALRWQFGNASRMLVESDLSAERVGTRTVALYRELLAGNA
jgi:glycosyltransferase involved in cell wall biosynthesis